MTGNIIVKPSVRQRFDSFMERGRVLFFSAPCGFGKTALADALLSGRDVLRLCETADELQQIYYGVDVPEQYQSEVLKAYLLEIASLAGDDADA